MPDWKVVRQKTDFWIKGQSHSNQAKTVARTAAVNKTGSTSKTEEILGSTSKPREPAIVEKGKEISSAERGTHFVAVPRFRSEHNTRENSKQARKPPDEEVSEDQVDENLSTPQYGEVASEYSEGPAVKKFNEKVFQSVHNIHPNTTQQGKAPENVVVDNNDVDKNVGRPAGIEGDPNNMQTFFLKQKQSEDSNEDDSFNETDFKSTHNISQNTGN